MKLMRLLLHILSLSLLLCISSCRGYEAERAMLDRADSLMESHPDSALRLLNTLDVAQLNNAEVKARHALLKSMALDKNLIDTTAFDILQPAIDFYANHGTPNDKLRTLYYQGRIYLNKELPDSAMDCFLQGRAISGISDSLTLARLYVAQGGLYKRQYKAKEFTDNNLFAARLFHAGGKHSSEFDSYSRAIRGAVLQDDNALADSIISIANHHLLLHPSEEYRQILRPSIAGHTIFSGDTARIRILIDTMRYENLSYNDSLEIAYANMLIGRNSKAVEIITSMQPECNLKDSMKYYILRDDILASVKDYKGSNEAKDIYIACLETADRALMANNLLSAEREYNIKIKHIHETERLNRIIIISVGGCILLLLLVTVILLLYKNKRAMHRMAEIQQRQSQLEAANLRSEVNQLEQEKIQLENVLQSQRNLMPEQQQTIVARLKVLEDLLLSIATNDRTKADSYDSWINRIHNDKQEFLKSSRDIMAILHPEFSSFTTNNNLTDIEINYICLYALGLSCKEIGTYLDTSSHYNVSSVIRKKIGLQQRTNLGSYLRNLLATM